MPRSLAQYVPVCVAGGCGKKLHGADLARARARNDYRCRACRGGA